MLVTLLERNLSSFYAFPQFKISEDRLIESTTRQRHFISKLSEQFSRKFVLLSILDKLSLKILGFEFTQLSHFILPMLNQQLPAIQHKKRNLIYYSLTDEDEAETENSAHSAKNNLINFG